jgi:hypothetical protein
MNCDFRPTGKAHQYRCYNCDFEVTTEILPITMKCQSRGLGDDVSKVTTKLGIHKCGGCKKRQQLLNKLPSLGKMVDKIKSVFK